MTVHNSVEEDTASRPVDAGLAALVAIAGYHRIAVSAETLGRELSLVAPAKCDDIRRAAKLSGLKSKTHRCRSADRLASVPAPAIAVLRDGTFSVYGGPNADATHRLIDPIVFAARNVSGAELMDMTEGNFVLIQRATAPREASAKFGFSWFLPSIWRYRGPLLNVLLASLFVQIFALIAPLFFQVTVDKVLGHRSYSTLLVLVIGLAAVGLFDVILQYLRTHALAHTANRIDVELGRRLFRHLLNLPLSYFETRAAGQTVARIRELETIRSFLTGQALFSGLDLLFTVLFIAVLFAYSSTLAWIVVATIPLFAAVGFLIRPALKNRIDEKFDRGAANQQLLVESVLGVQTLKSSAVEPMVASQWEERLAAYVHSSFAATLLAAKGQNLIQYINKVQSAALLLFGAQAVIAGELTVGGLVAFNMIAGQVSQPILRLSQLWQDFQQVQISVARLGDILNAPQEPRPAVAIALPPPKGAIVLKAVTFRYTAEGPAILKNIDLAIRPGEVIGIVGPSGSGKSTLTKLLQRFYLPNEGQITIDGQDISQVDPAWLRSQVGVVLQENMLFNRSIHDNICLIIPAMSREMAMRLAQLAGADEFISKLPRGYDTILEERGANLSGGQRQRLAIARALASNPPILILDEATSALDYESEKIILGNMREIVRGRTVLIIAHRLATVRNCDRIIALKDGVVVEQGRHDELVSQDTGLYAHLWRLQNGAAS